MGPRDPSRFVTYLGEIVSVTDIHRRYTGKAVASIDDHARYDALMNGGGFSHHVETGETPHSGYMVSLHKDHGGDETVVPLKDLTPEHIAEHRERARQAGGGIYQGGWVHDGKVYLDRSVNVQDPDEATSLGKHHKQLAIYDVAHAREIPLGE